LVPHKYEKESRLRVFEDRVLRKIFGHKRDEVTEEWRKLHIEKLNDMYSLSKVFGMIKSIKIRGAGRVARMGKSRNAYRVLVGKPEGKTPLRRSRLRWEDNINIDLQKLGCGGYGLDRTGSG
jgi:hypothetical protein